MGLFDNQQKEKAQYEAILESIGDGMIVTDTQETVTMVNKQAEMILDLKKTEIIGKRWSEVMPVLYEDGKPVPENEQPMKVVITHQAKNTTTAYYYGRKDSSRFAVYISASPIVLNNTLIGAVLIFRDITQEKEIDKAKSEFVSLASHQLKTPLSAINWHIELLEKSLKEKLNAKEKKYLSEIYESNQHMIDLVNALLNVSRIDLGKLAVNPKSTNLKNLATNVLKDFLPQIQEKRLIVKEKYDDPLPEIKIDPQLMRIVFQNLISNAIKYSYHNAIIEILITKAGPYIIATVTNEGIGIPDSEKKKIFGKLFRADNALQEVPDGNGLGLYITKAIIQQSGGRIWFHSEEKKKTTFYIQISLTGSPVKEGAQSLLDMK